MFSIASAPNQPSVTIKKVTIPAAPTNIFAGQTKEVANASTVKPANKNLEALAVGTVQASFSPLAKRRKFNDEPKSQTNSTDNKSKSDESVKNCKVDAKPASQSITENGTSSNGAATTGSGGPKTLKKTKKEFAVRMSSIMFKDIGGLEKILKELCELLMHIKHPEVYRFIGLPPPRGFLLHGPPGCGKTLLAQAIAGVSVWQVFGKNEEYHTRFLDLF